LSDKRKRYLRQQAELGGKEVYLADGKEKGNAKKGGAKSGRRKPASAQPEEPAPGVTAKVAPSVTHPVPAEVPAAPPPPAPAAAGRVETPGSTPKWMKDAPAVPGPGLRIVPPDPVLVGDEIAGLESLEAVATMISQCRRCRLCEGRQHTVPGEGNPSARLMCVGEGPGATEDETGRPFVGAAGQLLDQILAAIECPRETVFIANIVKCRPPQNRKPLPDEATACLAYLQRQIALVRPKVLLALGGTAAEWLLGSKKSLGELRGQVHSYAGIPVVVTYHPAALLRNPNWKRPTWDDVRIARQLLEG